jgi:DNA-binding transcriptional ArsR family regulator
MVPRRGPRRPKRLSSSRQRDVGIPSIKIVAIMLHIIRAAVALGDPTRLRLLEVLGSRGLSMTAVSDAVGIAPSTATFHIHKLEDAGLVDVVRRGRCYVVRRNQGRWRQVLAAFSA